MRYSFQRPPFTAHQREWGPKRNRFQERDFEFREGPSREPDHFRHSHGRDVNNGTPSLPVRRVQGAENHREEKVKSRQTQLDQPAKSQHAPRD